jgi:uncharacterized protein with von Willebrand factor type A (vWA) domain
MQSTLLSEANPENPSQVILEFVDYLRANGFVIGLGELQAMFTIVFTAGIDDVKRIEKCWRAIAASSKGQWQQFPQLFEVFWFPKKTKGTTKSSGKKKQGKSLPELISQMRSDMDQQVASQATKTVGLGASDNDQSSSSMDQGQGGASRVDPLVEKPLGDWLPSDSHQLDAFIAPLQERLRQKLLRHYQRRPQATRIDFPQSIRKAASTGGELIQLIKKERKTILPRLFILVDVSKSMESHAQFFLRMARSFCHILNARVFVFHTRLIEVTPLMKRDSGRVQEKINAVTFGFGGGTKIATNLEAFLEQTKLGPSGNHIRGIERRDIVYVLSDGFDTDPPEKTCTAIAAIRKKGAELFWLHPTKEVPQSEAIQMSQAWISGFMAVSHLSSLDGLVDLTLKKNTKKHTQITHDREYSWAAF